MSEKQIKLQNVNAMSFTTIWFKKFETVHISYDNLLACEFQRVFFRVYKLNMLFLIFQTHAKALESKNAQLVSENQRLVAKNDVLRSNSQTKTSSLEASAGPLVIRQPPESAVLTNVPQQQEQGCPLAGGPLDSTVSLIKASKLLLNVLKANRRQKKLPIKKRARWPT